MVSPRRIAILDAATRLFAARGYRETSTTDVARLTGSAEGTVFYHFESKEKLFLAVLNEVRNTIDRAFSEFLPEIEELAGLESFEALAGFYLELASKHQAEFMMLHRHQAYDLAEVNEECRDLLEAIYERFIGAFEGAILRVQQNDSTAPLPAYKTAFLVYMMLDGLVRMKHYNLYDADSLLEDFLAASRSLVLAREEDG